MSQPTSFMWNLDDIEILDAERILGGPEAKLWVLSVADSFSKQAQVAVRLAFVAGRNQIDRAALASAKSESAAVAATTKVSQVVQRMLERTLPQVLLSCLEEAGQQGLSKIVKQRQLRTAAKRIGPFKLSFDHSNPAVVKWAKRHAAEAIEGISETTRKAIRAAIVRAVDSGSLAEATDDIAAAVGDDDRARIIAHHETLTAASQGQRASWDQAVEKKLLTGEERRKWIATEGSACPICEALDGETAPLQGEYEKDGGDGPPQHVGCRCTEELQLEEV